MGNISAIVQIISDRKKAKEIASRVIEKGDKDGRPFGDILQEEIDKFNKERRD